MVMLSDDLSLAAMYRIIEKAGAKRVSESACKELAKVLEDIGIRIGKDALEFTMHAGRRTVKGKDIRIAAKKILNR